MVVALLNYGLKEDLIYHDPKEGIEGRQVANAILVFWEDIPRHDALNIFQSDSPIAQPGEKLALSFKLQNRGFLTWEHELPYRIKFLGGDLLGLSEFYSLDEDVPLGSVLEWSQSIVAPQTPGAYVSIWQMTYEDSAGNVEMIGPEVGFIVTVLPEGSSLNLGNVIRQIIDEAKREANETMEEFLLRVKEEIDKRIEEEMGNNPCCEPFLGILVLALASRKFKR